MVSSPNHRVVLVAGSANLDFVVRAPRIPAPGETVLGREFQTFAGGKGANQAVASARARGATTHVLLGLGENAITVASGAKHVLRPDHWSALAGLTHLLLQLETPLDTVTAYARAARAQGRNFERRAGAAAAS